MRDVIQIQLHAPYLVFLADVTDRIYAKTGLGVAQWCRDRCIGQLRLPGCAVDAGLPDMDIRTAAARGARSLILGVAPVGGGIQPAWVATLAEAARAGLDIVAGMHQRLASVPGLAEAAAAGGATLVDVRVPPPNVPVGSGRKRTGMRLLTVGTDCAVGKKYSALAIMRELQRRKVKATFRATGQTGIMIAGEGMPLDSVVADFIAGAAEVLSPSAPPDHIDVIEGQGSLFHPSYAGVALGLLHGSQPDGFVVCHEPGRQHVLGHAEFPLPSIEQVIEQTIALGRVTSPAIRCVGISLNTARLDEAAALREFDIVGKRLGLPVADPIRGGRAFERLLDACMS
jgi:uncharacterized NAD-dependent epimerase/dehydratase family protein